MTDLPAWRQQPGETWAAWSARTAAEKELAHAARLVELAEYPPYTGPRQLIPVGVATYDGNGNPKGAGW